MSYISCIYTDKKTTKPKKDNKYIFYKINKTLWNKFI